METKAFTITRGETEYHLKLIYNDRAQIFGKSLEEIRQDAVLNGPVRVRELPDRIEFSIRAPGYKQNMLLTGEEYSVLRELLSHDTESGRGFIVG